MSRPPMFVTMKFRSGDESVQQDRELHLWLPLFIIVPLLLLIALALFLVALPFFLLYIILTWDFRWWRPLRYGAPAFFQTMHALPGLKVNVEDRKQKFFIDID